MVIKAITHETRLRSLLKAVSFRLIEIAVDTAILSIFVHVGLALGLAMGLELTCFVLHYLFERVFNRIQWGRYIIEDNEPTNNR